MLAIVARQPFRMMLPVSASASCSSSMMSSSGRFPPATARTISRLLASGKISIARPVMSPSNTWCTATSLAASLLPQDRDARAAAAVRPSAPTEDFLADHFAQADGGAADADIDQLGQGIEFQFIQAESFAHQCSCAPASVLAHCAGRKSRSACSVSGLARKVAPTALARSTISFWWLAEITATGIAGRTAYIRRQMQAVPFGHVEIQQRIEMAFQRASASSALAGFHAGPVGMQAAQRLGDRHARELAVVNHQNFVRHGTNTRVLRLFFRLPPYCRAARGQLAQATPP